MKHLFLLLSGIIAFACNASDYLFSPEKQSELIALLNSNSLRAGDNIILTDGVFNNLGTLNITANGTPKDSIIIKAENREKQLSQGKQK